MKTIEGPRDNDNNEPDDGRFKEALLRWWEKIDPQKKRQVAKILFILLFPNSSPGFKPDINQGSSDEEILLDSLTHELIWSSFWFVVLFVCFSYADIKSIDENDDIVWKQFWFLFITHRQILIPLIPVLGEEVKKIGTDLIGVVRKSRKGDDSNG